MASDTEQFDMNVAAGLGGSLQAVADEFEQYTAELYKAYPGGAAAAGFVSKEAFVAMHAEPVKSGWAGYQTIKAQQAAAKQNHPAYSPYSAPSVSRQEIEAAAPFIRLVLERMLDLLDSEASWTKGRLAADAENVKSMDHAIEQAERWCILGAQSKALADLQLAPQGVGTELDQARQSVVAAIQAFFKNAMIDDHGTSIPSWNDATGTDYEDVRLWIKTLFDRIP